MAPRSRCSAALALALGLVLLAPAAVAGVGEQREAAYNAAVEALAEGEYANAATSAWSYLDGAARDDHRYDRALRLLATSAEKLGLRYPASLWYLDIAESRRDPELVPDALRGLERIVMGGPHDEDTLVTGFVATSEHPELPGDVQPFVDYHQGLDSARHGLDGWADANFARIPASSPYHGRARYVLAVRLVAQRKLVAARDALEALDADETLPEDVRVDVRRSLARLAYEDGRYDAALTAYQAIRDEAPDDPALLLEMAWTQFHLGDSRRALGLLMALDAPVYGDLIAPERFLLEALCLRRLCQFDASRLAAVRLGARHGSALADLRAGTPPMESAPLRAAARRRGETLRRAAFRGSLERELAWVGDNGRALGPKLSGALETILRRGLADAKVAEDKSLATEVRRVAEELLQADEGVRLILHELSVALLRGRRRPDGPAEAPAVEVSATGKAAIFQFTGEFWTDELDDLIVTLEDRCIE